MKLFLPGAGNKPLHILNFQELPDVSEVVISDTSEWAVGNFLAARSYLLPPFADAEFITRFERIFAREKFDVCLPLHDASLRLFSRYRRDVGPLPFFLAINPEETIDLVSDKLATFQFFARHGIPTVDTCLLSDFTGPVKMSFPCFVKPRFIDIRGTAEALFTKLDDDDDLAYVRRKLRGRESRFVVQPFLEGVEINIDFYCDGEGAVKAVVPLRRLAMGTSRGISRGEIIKDDRFESYISAIASKIRFWGANNAQAFVSADGQVRFTEINGRMSGSSVLVKEAGINLFACLVDTILGRATSIPEVEPGLRMTTWERPWFFTSSPATRI